MPRATPTTKVERLLTHPLLTRLLRVQAARIHYRGRRSGREISLTVWCRPTEDGVLIDVGAPGRKTWWRTFRTAAPIEVELADVRRCGTAQVQHPKPGRVQVRVTYR